MSNKSEATFHGTPVSEPEHETIGDWAGHQPAVLSVRDDTRITDALQQSELYGLSMIEAGIRQLIEAAGSNSRDHGFHEDWPVDVDLIEPGKDRDYQKAIVEKLALQHEEISESLGEIRSGRGPLEIYFVDHKGLIGPKGAEYPEQRYGTPDGAEFAAAGVAPSPGDVPLLKPEGFLVEQADAVIRIADLSFLVSGGEAEYFIEALFAKLEYNKTRPYKHGRKF